MLQVKKQTGYFKSFDGAPIYFEVRGTGRPIVMAYGLACLMNHWTHQVRYFAELGEYQTILIDYRGHHLSRLDKTEQADLSLDALGKDMVALCQHLQIPRASFWGHSFGVQVLMKAFELNPALFANMIFVNGFASNPIDGMFGVDTVAKVFHQFRSLYKRFPSTLGWAWRNAILNPAAIPLSALAGGFNLNVANVRDIEVYARGVAEMDLDVFLKLFGEMMAYDGRSTLQTIDCPVLIFSGDKDGVTPPKFQRNMHELIRGSEFQSVHYGSHCTQLDLPEFVNLRAAKFLKDHAY